MDVWIEIDIEREDEILAALRKLGFLKKYDTAAARVGESGMGIFFGRLDLAKHEAAAKIPGVRRIGHHERTRPAKPPEPAPPPKTEPAPEPPERQFRSPPKPRRRRRRR